MVPLLIYINIVYESHESHWRIASICLGNDSHNVLMKSSGMASLAGFPEFIKVLTGFILLSFLLNLDMFIL